jgi:hypothetical protein
MNGLHNTRASEIELGSELIGVQLPGLAITLVENVLTASAERSLLACFHKLLNVTVLEDTIGE